MPASPAATTSERTGCWSNTAILYRYEGTTLMRILTWSLLILVLALAACAPGSAIPVPPEIHYGEDICADCGMIISDPRFAAAYAHEIEPGRYESLMFDDMGDLVGNLKANQDRTVTDLWAHDYWSEEWLDAETAFYVVSTEIRSPMGHGIAAFAEEAKAQELAAELHVEVLDWNRMRAEVLMHDH